MLRKRVLAIMLCACMIASPIAGSSVSAAGLEPALGSSFGDGATVSGNSGVIDNNGILNVLNANLDTETFEGGDIGSWGMTGELAESVSVADDGTGNSYLKLTNDKASTKSAVKTFDVPFMTKAAVSFKLYTTSLTSDSRNGYAAVSLRANGAEVLSLCWNDLRSSSDSADLYCYTNDFDKRETVGTKVANGGSYDVSIDFDFAAGTAAISIDGALLKTVTLPEDTYRVNQFAFFGAGSINSGRTFTVDMGIDNFAMTYEEDSTVDGQAIKSVAELDEVSIGKEEWDNGYAHPTTAKAILVSGEQIDVEIDAATWTAEPAFDSMTKGKYLWTANIVAPAGHANDKNLTVSYTMVYAGPSVVVEHDYFEDFELSVWDVVAWGSDMGGTSGGGYMGISQAQEENGNSYMKLEGLQQRGDRGNRYDLNSGEIEGATVEFDWMPSNVSNCEGQVMFVSPDSWNSYFTLQVDTNYKISAYTKCPLSAASTTQTEFAGSVDMANAIATGLGGKDKWYTVKLIFNYRDNIANLTITDKADSSQTFNMADIPIDPAAKGIKSMVMKIQRWASKNADLTMGVDNMTVDYGLVIIHDYEDDFTNGVWDTVPWGKEMDSTSGTGTIGLSAIEEADGNIYMQAAANNQGGSRGNRLDLQSGIVKGSSVQFDWRLGNITSGGAAQIMFVAPNTWNSYFTLRFDTDYKIKAYTKCPLGSASTKQQEFAGSIAKADAINTQIGEQNKWYTVHVTFDYMNHTADLTITDKDNGESTFKQTGIPIATEANGINSMVLHLERSSNKPSISMGFDNIAIDYDKMSKEDVISVTQLSDLSLSKEGFEAFSFPTEIEAELGDGSSKTLALGEWTAEPAFSVDAGGDYVWSAPLVLDGLNNPFGLKATFNLKYTLYPYPVYAHNPNTLELEFGETLPAFPERVIVFLSDDTTSDMPIDTWVPIREFNAQEEGIYVYGANVVAEPGKTQIDDSVTLKNEHHVKGDDQAAYTYDVYYRVSYFKSQDNYNAYQRSMEYLDRGVYAVTRDDGVFVSWRLLATEYGEEIAFNIYRNGALVNEAPITDKTNYVDTAGKAGDVYTVETILGNKKSTSAGYVASEQGYLSIPLQKPEPQDDGHGTAATYSINDAGVADVDGDGEYEIIVKWYPSNAFDSGKAVTYSSPTIFDIYEMDGTALWRLNMGLEMPSGAHFNQFMLYDFDEDGKAELFIKTSDGTVSYKPNAEGKFDMTDESTIVSYIGDKTVVPGTNIGSNGHALASSNEYVTMFNGETGKEIDTIDFVNTTGNYADWGKSDGGNRSARYNVAVAYLPKDKADLTCTETIPAVLFNRGYYDKTTVIAYTLRDGKIETEWNFVALGGTEYAGKGNHNMSTGDMDNDGFDELVIGSMALDHDGSVLWVKNGKEGQDYSGHGDAIHLSAMSPDSNQLYVFAPEEDTASTLNYHLSNAGNGTRIAGNLLAPADIGRGMAANITPNPGFEYWANRPNSETADNVPVGSIYNFYGDVIAMEKPVNFSTNFCMYWDGDLLSELVDSYNPSVAEGAASIFKYDWEKNEMVKMVTFEGTKMNNSTKNTPSLTADLFGDWREEMIVRSEDDSELRIYMTTEETDYMIYTLMHDPVYRNSVANQNTSYNQPTHLGFYLGEDVAEEVLAMKLPTANIAYTTGASEEEPKEINSLSELSDVAVTTEEAKNYKHPEKVTAVLDNGTDVEVMIDGDSWKAEPVFDAAKEGEYVWTADIVVPEGCANSKKLTVSYTMTVKAAVVDKFEDVEEGQWYVSAVQYVYNHGYMNGKSEITFDPMKNLTRAEFATVLYSMAGKPAVEYKDIFPDVEEGFWYTSPVMWAFGNEIVSGYDSGYFGTFDNISREQIALMLYKYAKLQGYDTGITEGAMSNFTDYETVHTWAAEAVNWAVSNGVMSGKPNGDGTNSLDPLSYASRAECAAMIRSMMTNVAK